MTSFNNFTDWLGKWATQAWLIGFISFTLATDVISGLLRGDVD